jgi:hypothetical protein
MGDSGIDKLNEVAAIYVYALQLVLVKHSAFTLLAFTTTLSPNFTLSAAASVE